MLSFWDRRCNEPCRAPLWATAAAAVFAITRARNANINYARCIQLAPAQTSPGKQAKLRARTREHGTLGTKQHKLHDQIRVIQLLMKNLILHPRNFVCGYVFTIYLSQYYCKWIGPPMAIMCRVRISVGRVSEKGWKPVRFQAGFHIEYLQGGITKGDALFETRLEVPTGLKTAHLNAFH
jgi:hypothetical protein